MFKIVALPLSAGRGNNNGNRNSGSNNGNGNNSNNNGNRNRGHNNGNNNILTSGNGNGFSSNDNSNNDENVRASKLAPVHASGPKRVEPAPEQITKPHSPRTVAHSAVDRPVHRASAAHHVKASQERVVDDLHDLDMDDLRSFGWFHQFQDRLRRERGDIDLYDVSDYRYWMNKYRVY